ncbi:hypothetical protein CPT_Moonbeam47 [Bacillus phage Moonbeam]|uniref:Uncharacterized protein n=1 Tax=Bacillus phage Moonbeam TaxID=1540091 RepID=A0A0A0RMZ6_9CAUD|nr:hypothetical protein CPT_Moonbeam47 [Bacillus phage Moonbeam]AIW03445.1 hypothetical protein CPT_Moonbeam47 [Bacillus phage Moonbeam]
MDNYMTYAEFMHNLSVLNKAYTQSILELWGFKITY